MGGDSGGTTTEYQRQSLPGWYEATTWPMYSYLQQYLMPGPVGWQGSMTAPMSPYEQGGLNLYSSALGSLFGQTPYAPSGQQFPGMQVPQTPPWFAMPLYVGGGGGAYAYPDTWQGVLGGQTAGAGAGVGAGGPAEPSWWAGRTGGINTDWTFPMFDFLGGIGGGGSPVVTQGNPQLGAADRMLGIPEGMTGGGGLGGGMPARPGWRPMEAGGGAAAGGDLGGLFGASQAALEGIVSPDYLDVMADPWFRQAMAQQEAGLRRSYAGGGIEYGTPLEDALMRGASETVLGELGRRRQLQASVGQFGTEFPMMALQGFQPWAQMPRSLQQQDINRWYQEFLRQQGQGREDVFQGWQMGLGMAGNPYPTSTSQSTGWGDFLGQAALTAAMLGWNPFGAAGAGFTGSNPAVWV